MDWRPVAGFEGLYEVSDHGDVMRVGKAARNGNGRGGGARIGRILRQHLVTGGYHVVQLWSNGKPSTQLVARVVVEAFRGPIPDRYTVDHLDGNKDNNALSNLEAVTHGENNRRAYAMGLIKPHWHNAAAARRKPRVAVACACGCMTMFETPDAKGRDRRYISGHNMRRTL